MANITPVHKKNSKQNKTKYRPISLLSCMEKVLKKLDFKTLYGFCERNNLLTWKNSGFKPLDSTVNQLISIIHQIYTALETGQEVCIIFLDVSKAFYRVYHDGLIHKLQCMGIGGNLLQWLTSYLSNRRQRVVINGQSSQWKETNAGVPQGSILGPLLFLIYVNDIVDDLESSPCLFADDTSLLEVISDVQTSFDKLIRDLARLADWAHQWRLTFNATKTVHMVISKRLTRPQYPELLLNGQKI
jgi:hypothetical protein